LTLSNSALAQNKRNSLAQSVFKTVRPFVFQIKTALGPESPKASYGSGFVVHEDGYLVTNYHVVSQSVQEPNKYKMFLIDGEETLEAKILGVDIIHDLAVVKVDKKFKKVLKLARRMPEQGAKIFSVGLPKDLNIAITEGNYNGVVQSGIYRRVHMASPLNSGMSGGPTVNKHGNVIGVNVAVLISSQNISFSVPVEFVKKIMARTIVKSNAKGASLNDEKPKEFDSMIAKQIKQIQFSLISDLERSKGVHLKLADWTVRKPSKILKCWSTNGDDEDGYYQSVREICYLQEGAFIKGKMTTGSYEVEYNTFKSSRLSPWQLLSLSARTFNQSNIFSSVLFNDFYLKDDLLTKFSCAEKKLVNKNGVPILVNYCLRAYVKYPSIYNIDFKLITLTKDKRALVMSAGLSGFTMGNIKKFMEIHINGIKVN